VHLRLKNGAGLCLSLAMMLSCLSLGCKSSAQPFDQFPIRKQTKYFDFHYERNSPQIEGTARFADAYVRIVDRDFFPADFNYPIQVYVLANPSRFENFVQRDLKVPGPAGYGIYLYANKLLATYESSGLGTFTHESMHAFVERDLSSRPAWADEGIPTFFEKFYGYWKGDELVLYWGFQNPWRIEALGPDLTRLNLAEIVSDASMERDESQLRMVSLFLWRQGKFRRFLRRIAANDKGGFSSYLEAAMDMQFENIIPLWQSYLRDVEQHRTEILSLPLSTVCRSEEEFQNFAKVNGISRDQVVQAE
jgi:hypothetical protein